MDTPPHRSPQRVNPLDTGSVGPLDWLMASLALVLTATLVARLWGHWRPPSKEPAQRALLLDSACAVALAGYGLWWSYHLFGQANPAWIPTAQDFAEYSGTLGKVLAPDSIDIYWNRSLLYPWLATLLVHGLGLTPYDAAIHLSIASSGLLAAAVWAVVRQIAPRPIALGSGLLVLHLPAAMERLGHVSDYATSHLLSLLCLAAGLLALRRPKVWAFLLAGCALTLVLACTPKGLAVALVLLPLLALGVPWRRPNEAALAAAAVMGPIAMGWWLYGSSGIEHSSLEWGVIGLKQTWAATQGIRLDNGHWGLPLSVGDPGTWRFGGDGALDGLYSTITVMIRSPIDYPSLAARVADSPALLCEALSLRSPLPLALAALGCLAPLVTTADRARGLAAAVLLLAFLGTQALGAHGVPLRSYYVIHLLVLAPGLALAAAWLVGRSLLAGPASTAPLWALPALALCLLHSPAGIGHSHAQQMVLAHQFGFLGNPSATTTATRLRDELRAGDVVLDATTHRQGLDAFYGLAPVQAAAQPRGTTAVTGSGIEAERRFVVLDCAFGHRFPPQALMLAQTLNRAPRFHPWASCIYLDDHPDQPVDIQPGPVPDAAMP